MLNDIITRLREIESEASFSVMRMQNIDRIRNANDVGFSDVFGVNVNRRYGLEHASVAYSVENFAYDAFSLFVFLLHQNEIAFLQIRGVFFSRFQIALQIFKTRSKSLETTLSK